MRMLEFISSATALALTMAVSSMSFASTTDQSQRVEVVKRGANGHAVIVRVDGKEYAVCTRQIQDSCINPQQAGLRWGHEPLAYWPGKPASELRQEGEGLGG